METQLDIGHGPSRASDTYVDDYGPGLAVRESGHTPYLHRQPGVVYLMTGVEAFEYALKGKSVRRKGSIFPFCFDNGRMRVPGGMNLPTQRDWLADDWELVWPEDSPGKPALSRLVEED